MSGKGCAASITELETQIHRETLMLHLSFLRHQIGRVYVVHQRGQHNRTSPAVNGGGFCHVGCICSFDKELRLQSFDYTPWCVVVEKNDATDKKECR
mmetsp:Transcript_14636/g.34428  ORF Transcript_14636/g.34428 Transcript_14636/m.34428 type:complete len:97 (+) Transcript_14636:191-481(+)